MSVTTISAQVNGFNPSVIGGTGTTYKIFPALNYPNSGLGSVGAQTPCSLVVPANGQYEGQRMTVTAGGNIYVHGTSPTVLFAMYNGTSMTPGSDGTPLVVLASALSLTTATTYPWTWQTVFQGDSISGKLQAVSSSLWVNNANAGTVTLTGATGINFMSGGPTGAIGSGYSAGPALNLILGIEFTVSDALNAANLDQWTLES